MNTICETLTCSYNKNGYCQSETGFVKCSAEKKKRPSPQLLLAVTRNFDEQNRVHIPPKFLRALGIEGRDSVLVALDKEKKQILIRKEEE